MKYYYLIIDKINSFFKLRSRKSIFHLSLKYLFPKTENNVKEKDLFELTICNSVLLKLNNNWILFLEKKSSITKEFRLIISIKI